MPSNIDDHQLQQLLHRTSHLPHHQQQPQRCFQCHTVGGPLLTAASDNDDDDDPQQSYKPRYCNDCMIGKKVKVFWPVDSSWYTGIVQEYDPSTGEHCLQYVDGDTEWVKIGDLSGQQQQQSTGSNLPPLSNGNDTVKNNTTGSTIDRPSNTTTTSNAPRSSYRKPTSTQYTDDPVSPISSSKINEDANDSTIPISDANEDLPTTILQPQMVSDKEDAITQPKGATTYYDGRDTSNGPPVLSGKSTSPFPYNAPIPSMYTSGGGGGGSTALSGPPFGGGHPPPPQGHPSYMYPPPQYGPPSHHLGHLPPPSYLAQLHHPMMMSHHNPYDPTIGLDHLQHPGAVIGSSGELMGDYPPPGSGLNPSRSDMMHMHIMNSSIMGNRESHHNNNSSSTASQGGSRSRKSGPKPWTKEEDNLLLSLVHTMQWPMKWTVVAHSLPDRTGKQCRERYVNHLNPRLKNSDWAPIEDATIFHLYNTIGSHWAKMSKIIPGRTDNGIKNRFHNIRRQYEREDTHRLRLSNVDEYEEEVRHDRLRNFPEHMSGKSLSLWDMKCGIGVIAAQSILSGSTTCNTLSASPTLTRISINNKNNTTASMGNTSTSSSHSSHRFGPFREVVIAPAPASTSSSSESKSDSINTDIPKGEVCVRCGLIVPSIHTGNEICTKTGWCISCVFIPPNICGNLLRETLNLRRCCVDPTTSETTASSLAEMEELRSIIESFEEYFHPKRPEDAWPYKTGTYPSMKTHVVDIPVTVTNDTTTVDDAGAATTTTSNTTTQQQSGKHVEV